MIYIKLAFILIISLVSGGAGWYFEHLRYDALESQFQSFQDKVASEGKLQEVKNEQVKSEQQLISKTVSANYESRIAQLHQYYGGMLISKAGSSSSPMPSVSTSPPKLDARPSDIVITEQCAITTEMYISLRDWVNQQSEIK